ncbi:MAG: hypothetical protein PHE12_03395 [Clostridia bacterium]|nr:hypothetical protein [Clostridia bacterium]
MNRFIRLLLADTKRLFFGKKIYIIFALCIIFSIAIYISSFNSDNDDNQINKSSYNIQKYENMAQLADFIEAARQEYQKESDKLHEDIELANLTQNEIKYKQNVIGSLKRTLMTAEYLFNNNIAYENYQDYGFISNIGMSQRSGILIFNIIIYCVTLGLVILSIIRAATYIPNEICSGRYKITFTVPLKRSKYVLYRFLFIFLQSAIFLTAYAIMTALISAILYGAKDVLIFGTKDYVFGLGYIFASMFLLLFYLFHLFVLCVLALSLSLLINNRIVPLLLTLFIYLGDKLIFQIISLLIFVFNGFNSYDFNILPWLFGSNIQPLNAFTGIANNSIFIYIGISLIYLLPISAATLFKFTRQDIK